MIVLTMWLLLLTAVLLAAMLIIRVNVRDWGMVGLTIFVSGVAVVMVRSVLLHYGVTWLNHEMFVLWRLMAIVGSGIAAPGIIAGIFRDPPPLHRVVIRFALVVAMLSASVLLIEMYMRLSGSGSI